MTLTKKIFQNKHLWLFVWILWMGAIFVLSQMPGNPSYYTPTIQLLLERKGAHVVEYAGLLLLSVQAFSFIFRRASLRELLALAIVWSLAYAALDELHQFFVPFRGAHIQDVGIDACGIAIMTLIIYGIISFQKKKTP